MARNQNDNAEAQRDNKPPRYVAWHVAGRDKKAFWTRVGAAWDHKDGEGLTLQLDMVPINGRIVLRAPQEPKVEQPIDGQPKEGEAA